MNLKKFFIKEYAVRDNFRAVKIAAAVLVGALVLFAIAA